MSKKHLTEQEVRTQFITPAIQKAGWAVKQIREDYAITAGRIIARGGAPMQLKWDARSKIHTEFPSYNMGEAKGLSFDRVLIYPTGEMANWLSSHSVPLPPTTRAKFYVALTRARHSVAIIIDDKHKLWKNPPSDIQTVTF